MFAVPGWSVPAEALKTQADLSTQSAADLSKSSKPSHKRKRGHGPPNRIEITSENLAELWEKYVEGKSKGKSSSLGNVEGSEERKKKKRRKNKGPDGANASEANGDGIDGVVEGRGEIRKEARLVEDAGRSEPQTIAQENGYNNTTKNLPNATDQSRKPKPSGKANYEDRIRKKQEKAASKTLGASPPSEPSPTGTTDAAPKATTVESSAQAEEHEAPGAQRPTSKKSTPKSRPLSQKPSPPNPPTASNPPTKPPPTVPSTTTSTSKPQPLPFKPPPPTTSTSPTLPPPPPPQNLTPLQKSMALKLLSSRFRHLNQTLYTTPSTHASHLFTTTPSAYTAYHAGFRAQVAIWPQNPVDGFIADLRARGRIQPHTQRAAFRAQKRGKKSKNKKVDEESGAGAEALPRTSGTCHIADLGCGDAQLAAALQSQKSLNLRIRSFDLAKGDGPHKELVTVADSTHLPLRDGEIDVAICCLSLMGTNWVEVVDEVGRVVRAGGEVWVAEIRSRFSRVGRREGGKGVEKGVEKGMEKKKRGKGDGEEEDVGVVEVDSDPEMVAPGKRKGEETDVGAFVEVWRRRGFELRGEVELGNKMFAKMVFGKGRVGERVGGWMGGGGGGIGKGREGGGEIGKGREGVGGGEKGREVVGGRRGGMGKTKFIDGPEGEVSKEEEAKVLKPCVYKLR